MSGALCLNVVHDAKNQYISTKPDLPTDQCLVHPLLCDTALCHFHCIWSAGAGSDSCSPPTALQIDQNVCLGGSVAQDVTKEGWHSGHDQEKVM